MNAKTRLRFLSHLSRVLIVLGITAIAIIAGNWGNFQDTFIEIDPNFRLYLIGYGILGGFGAGAGVGIGMALFVFRKH